MKVGDIFTHKHFITINRKPIVCRISAIRHGMVYYHSETGVKLKMTLERFEQDGDKGGGVKCGCRQYLAPDWGLFIAYS